MEGAFLDDLSLSHLTSVHCHLMRENKESKVVVKRQTIVSVLQEEFCQLKAHGWRVVLEHHHITIEGVQHLPLLQSMLAEDFDYVHKRDPLK
jgi:hypothetical protein